MKNLIKEIVTDIYFGNVNKDNIKTAFPDNVELTKKIFERMETMHPWVGEDHDATDEEEINKLTDWFFRRYGKLYNTPSIPNEKALKHLLGYEKDDKQPALSTLAVARVILERIKRNETIPFEEKWLIIYNYIKDHWYD